MSFLGLCNYYRRFIKGYSAISAPITNLLRKDREFEWSTEINDTFRQLKEQMSVAPVLAISDPTKEFIVTTDASDFAIGVVLFKGNDRGQLQHIAFESRKLSLVEQNYAVNEKEILAILHAIKTW